MLPRLLIWKTDWDRLVDTLIQFFSTARVTYVGFIRDLVNAGSVDFVEDTVEHVGLFVVAKKAGAQRFIGHARPKQSTCLRPPACILFTGEGLCHVEFHEPLEDAQNWFVCSANIINAFTLDGYRLFFTSHHITFIASEPDLFFLPAQIQAHFIPSGTRLATEILRQMLLA